MRIALIADSFPPLRNSCAIQLRDLSREFVRQGHDIYVLTPSAEIKESFRIDFIDGIYLIRLKAPNIRDIGWIQRTLAELLLPFAMLKNFRNCPLKDERLDGVVWYSPSIFLGFFAHFIKKTNSCRSYLIIRDIFPEWALDMGLISRGLPYKFFNLIAQYQYSVADVIGVQTIGNFSYFNNWIKKPYRKLEVLQNWLAKPVYMCCSIRINETSLAGRKIFVYAGNMGVAQGMDILLELAEKLVDKEDVGFLFVGRGSEVLRLKNIALKRELNNVLFFDEIHPDEIPDLYEQCCFGLVALDPKHKSHNIPGKFLSYMQSGLPVLVNMNMGSDLAKLIKEEQVGQVEDLLIKALYLLNQINKDTGLSSRCRQLFNRRFSVEPAARQIVSGLGY